MESSRLVAEMGLNVTSSAFSAARGVDIMFAEEWVQWHADEVPRY
jgi:hypothetical protein